MSLDPVTAAQEVGFKVFVGNLSFTTTDEDIKAAFGAIGPITSAVVIHRGDRSLGYGFICYAVEADATRAVAELNHSEIAGRQINVEAAKPAAAPRAPRAPVEPRAPRAPKVAAEPRAVAEQEIGEDGQVIVKKPKKKSSRARKAAAAARQPRTDGETEEAGDAPLQNGAEPAVKASRPPRAPRPAQVRRGPPTGEPSKTLIFVANLPFSVDDDKLGALFEGLSIVSSRVVVKKFGAGEGRSKGFGFVDFASETDQKAALARALEVEGRAIELKVAIDAKKEDESNEAEATIVAS